MVKTRRRLKITPVLVTLNVLVLLLIVAFYGTRMIKYYLKENGKSNDKDNIVLLVDTVLKKQSYVDLTKGLIFDEEKNEYRYLGEVDDNYLEYSGIVYRIIGIDKDKNIKVISDKLKQYKAKNIVIDPVMVATSGARLINEDAVDTLKKELFHLQDIHHIHQKVLY